MTTIDTTDIDAKLRRIVVALDSFDQKNPDVKWLGKSPVQRGMPINEYFEMVYQHRIAFMKQVLGIE